MMRVYVTTVAVENSITYYKCVFVALGIQHAMRIHHVVTFGVPGSTIFFHIILYKVRFSKKAIEFKM
jgi:hypothetical protein